MSASAARSRVRAARQAYNVAKSISSMGRIADLPGAQRASYYAAIAAGGTPSLGNGGPWS